MSKEKILFINSYSVSNMELDINLTETVSCSLSQETGTPVQECEVKANYMTGTDNSLDDLEVISE